MDASFLSTTSSSSSTSSAPAYETDDTERTLRRREALLDREIQGFFGSSEGGEKQVWEQGHEGDDQEEQTVAPAALDEQAMGDGLLSLQHFEHDYKTACHQLGFPVNPSFLSFLQVISRDLQNSSVDTAFCELVYDGQHGPLSRTGAMCLAQAVERNRSLHWIDLTKNKIEDDGCVALLHALRRRGDGQGVVPVHLLELSENRLTSKCVPAVVDFAFSSAGSMMHTVSLRGNKLGSVAGSRLLRSLVGNLQIRKLDLSQCDLTHDIAAALKEFLELNGCVNELNLSNNRLGDRTLDQVMFSLRNNTALSCLDLSNCQLGFGGGKALATALAGNRSLVRLELEYNNISQTLRTRIQSLLRRNSSAADDLSVSGPRTEPSTRADILASKVTKPRPVDDPLSPAVQSPADMAVHNVGNGNSPYAGNSAASPRTSLSDRKFADIVRRNMKLVERCEQGLPVSEKGNLRDFVHFLMSCVKSARRDVVAGVSEVEEKLLIAKARICELESDVEDREQTILDLDSQCAESFSGCEKLMQKNEELEETLSQLRTELEHEKAQRQRMVSEMVHRHWPRSGSSPSPKSPQASSQQPVSAASQFKEEANSGFIADTDVELLHLENRLLAEALLETQRQLTVVKSANASPVNSPSATTSRSATLSPRSPYGQL